MLTKSTPVVMTTTALIIVCSLVPWLTEGGWEGDEGDGVVRLELRSPQALLPLCPCWPAEAPDGLGPLAQAPRPQVWCPVSPVAAGAEGAPAGRAVYSPFATRELKAQLAK